MLNPGSTVGSYRIVRRLGSGGFGAVYEVTHAESEERFALKITQAENPEADFLRRLSHPHVPQFVDQFHTSNGYATVTALIAGDSLVDVSASKKQSAESLVTIVKDVASAVAHAHESGIVHRDIKPENILVDAAGRGTLIDWGAASFIDRPVESNAGTVPYMHPAALSRLAGLGSTHASVSLQEQDLYSLGIVLFEAASGQLPFSRPESQSSVIAQARQLLGELPQLQDNIAAATDVSATLRSIAIACTDSADTSYSQCDQLVDDLATYLNRRPLRHAAESAATIRDRLWRRYGQWLLTLAVAAIILMTTFAIDRWNTQSTLSRLQLRGESEHEDVLLVILETGFFPDSPALREQRAMTSHSIAARHLKSDRAESAKKLLNGALALTPKSGKLHNDLGTALFQLGEFEQAIESFSRALEHPCDHASVFSNRGAAFAASGDLEKARQDFIVALQLDPHHKEAQRHLEMLDATESTQRTQ